MTSIYRQALGNDFERLHPEIRRRFGFSSADRIAAIGRGIMEEIRHGPAYTKPFLQFGTRRHIMFPAQGRDIPFTIENYAYRDGFGRETVTWIRTFQFPSGPRRFDATMIYDPRRRRVIDYLGTHQHLAVDIRLGVSADGGLELRSEGQRFYEGPVGFRFPMLFSGFARVREWFDERDRRFRIQVRVTNPLCGELFAYRGWFDVEWRPCAPEEVPPHARPSREESRS